MALKLLTRKDAPVENKEMGIVVRFGRLMPEHISIMQGLLQTSDTREAASARVGMFALRDVVSEISVKGEKYDALALGYNLDTLDPDNRLFLVGLAAIIIEELLVTEGAKKKPGVPPAPSGEASDVPAA